MEAPLVGTLEFANDGDVIVDDGDWPAPRKERLNAPQFASPLRTETGNDPEIKQVAAGVLGRIPQDRQRVGFNRL